MKAGRELDALIAEKIFGWRDYMPQNTGGVRLLPPERAALWGDGKGGQGIPLATADDPRDVDRTAGVPDYSTDIAAAWLVVEKFPLMSIQKQSGGCYVFFYGGSAAHAVGETAPLAICLAALASVGVELEAEHPRT